MAFNGQDEGVRKGVEDLTTESGEEEENRVVMEERKKRKSHVCM